jgi:hypothetical protein
VSTNGLLRLWVDDGAIVYLNGQEILRIRMPAGAVTCRTFASTLVSANGGWASYDVPISALVKGTNVLAAEVTNTTPPAPTSRFGPSCRRVPPASTRTSRSARGTKR